MFLDWCVKCAEPFNNVVEGPTLCETCREKATWVHHAIAPGAMEVKCEECGECDCKNGHHGEAILCQMVGECRGLAYDLWINSETNVVLCDNCFETRDV